LVPAQRHHLAEATVPYEVRGGEAEAGREHAVARGRRPAALHVAEDGHSRLEARPVFDLPGELLADAAEADVTELVELGLLRDFALLAGGVRQLVSLADDDDREVLAAAMPFRDLLAGLLDGQRVLRDENHVRAAGDPAHDRDPARVA